MRLTFVLVGLCLICGDCFAVDLAKLYPPTLDFFEGQPTREWTCTKGDVWSLKSFSYDMPGQLSIELGPSAVVFGVHEKNVVWAAVLPDEPGTVKTKLAGDGAKIESIWMRFNPAHLGGLFPDETVIGNGPEEEIVWGTRICRWKIRSGWQANDLPVIPKKGSLVFDVDTPEGQRHYYVVDLDRGGVEHVDAFNNAALPRLVPFTREESLRAFDTVWDAFDKEYPRFGLRPEVDWKKTAAQYRAQAEQAKTTYETAAAISAMLEHLRDLHIYVKVGNEFVPGYRRPQPLNANIEAAKRQVEGWTQTPSDLIHGKTADNIGYINIYALNKKELPKAFDEALKQYAETWGLIIDLRFNGGGDETLAREIAGRFLDKKCIYSFSRFRDGPAHDDLGPKLERTCGKRGPWRYESPVVVLWGQRTISSAESFALMLAQCPQVTTMGDRTAGSSACPRQVQLEGDIIVNLPRWMDLDPEGKSIEDVGIDPEIKVDANSEQFTALSDPVFEKALEHLRAVPQNERQPGKRE